MITMEKTRELTGRLEALKEFRDAAEKLASVMEAEGDTGSYATGYPFAENIREVTDKISVWLALETEGQAQKVDFKDVEGEVLRAWPGYPAVIDLKDGRMIKTTPVQYVNGVYNAKTIFVTQNSVYTVRGCDK